MRGDSIRSKYLLEVVPVLAVEGLGEICKVHIDSLLPFRTLPNNISRHENMIDTTPSPSPETCLFLAKFKVMMAFGRILLGVDNGIKTEKKGREKGQLTFLRTKKNQVKVCREK